MADALARGIRSLFSSSDGAVPSIFGIDGGGAPAVVSETAAMKLSAVNRCVEVLSDSVAKLPIYVVNAATRERVPHFLTSLLDVRANVHHAAFVAKKMVEANRLLSGNGYLWIVRDPATMRPVELIPVPSGLVNVWFDQRGHRWYDVTHPVDSTPHRLDPHDMIHLMAYTRDGKTGTSVLSYAADVIAGGNAASVYNRTFYERGGQPSGLLHTESDLSGTKKIKDSEGAETDIAIKDLVRQEWEKRHGGAANAFRIAVLDLGLKYQPMATTNRDAQFVENSEISVQDIARFFGVPLYKLQAGKQSYSSNEQNAIEYIVSTLQPIITQWEEELTWKLLTQSEIAQGLRIRLDMFAELRGDYASRAAWFKAMRDTGGFSVNDIREKEDLPDVEGGDERNASLNYVPLSLWRELSIKRNGGNKK